MVLILFNEVLSTHALVTDGNFNGINIDDQRVIFFIRINIFLSSGFKSYCTIYNGCYRRMVMGKMVVETLYRLDRH